MRLVLILLCAAVLSSCSDSASMSAEIYPNVGKGVTDNLVRTQYFRISENERLVGAVDVEDEAKFYISGGVDASRFSISHLGDLYFIESPDYEFPQDHDYQNDYELIVEVMTASNPESVDIVVDVYDVIHEHTSDNQKFERWPNYSPPRALRPKISQLQEEYASKKVDPRWREAGFYDSTGHYLGYGVYGDCQSKSESNTVKLREDGVLMLNKNGSWHTSPVASAQCGLHHYLYNGRQLDSVTKAYINDLLASQDDTGAFRYQYEITYRNQNLGVGWISGMAQGQAISFFSRVLQDHHIPEVEIAARKAVELLMSEVSRGGAMSSLAALDESLSSYVAFEEIITEPNSLILNGFMFALLGLYDWSHAQTEHGAESHTQAGHQFSEGIATLREILPYYDVGGWSTYDLAHITMADEEEKLATPEYHAAHIYLLEAMYSITNDHKIGHVLRVWSGYVDYSL